MGGEPVEERGAWLQLTQCRARRVHQRALRGPGEACAQDRHGGHALSGTSDPRSLADRMDQHQRVQRSEHRSVLPESGQRQHAPTDRATHREPDQDDAAAGARVQGAHLFSQRQHIQAEVALAVTDPGVDGCPFDRHAPKFGDGRRLKTRSCAPSGPCCSWRAIGKVLVVRRVLHDGRPEGPLQGGEDSSEVFGPPAWFAEAVDVEHLRPGRTGPRHDAGGRWHGRTTGPRCRCGDHRHGQGGHGQGDQDGA